MADTTTEIPVIWETTQSVAERLLGRSGLPLLDQTLSLAKRLAVQRKWPLLKIRIELYQDPEIVWEYLLIVLVFDCVPATAQRLWDEFIDATGSIQEGLGRQEVELFIKAIGYEFECNPKP